MTKKLITYSFFHVLIPLLIGLLLYLLFAENQLPLLGFSKIISNFESFNELHTTIQKSVQISDFLIYQMPDGLWAYAFCAAFLLIWRFKNAAIVTFSAFLFCSFYELIQYFNLTAGTFDWWDIFAMAIGCFAAYLLIK